MALLKKVFLFFFYTSVINCLANGNESEATEKTLNGIIGNKTELCANKPCVRKCCSINSVAYMMSKGDNSGSCMSKQKVNLTLHLPKPPVYTQDLELTDKTFESSFEILKGWTVIRNGWLMKDNFYLIENGYLLHDVPNVWNRWWKYDVDEFCIDNLYVNGTNEAVLVAFFLGDKKPPEEKTDYTVTIVAMLLSSMFLLATLSVFLLLPQLRHDRHGRVVVAYSASLLGYFLTQSVYQITYQNDVLNPTLCHILGIPSYYILLTAFFWMNVMSIDIFLSFRKYANDSNSYDSKSNNFAFYKFCIYGFGVPMAMTIIFAFLNYLPMDRINRAVITPGITSKACFLGGAERTLYVYIPMVFLLSMNLILSVATMCTMCSFDKTIGQSAKQIHMTRFVIAVSLIAVSGLGWFFKMASSFEPNLFFWKITNTYNSLMGVVVFVIFVCNRKVTSLISNRCIGNDMCSPAKLEIDDPEKFNNLVDFLRTSRRLLLLRENSTHE